MVGCGCVRARWQMELKGRTASHSLGPLWQTPRQRHGFLPTPVPAIGHAELVCAARQPRALQHVLARPYHRPDTT